MANTITTPNMNLPNPVPGVDPGPDYANNISSCFNILDQHNHSPPNGGVQINPSGININSSLAFNNQLATGLQAVIFTNQSSLSTLNALYTINGDLWYNDASNPVQITLGGNVNATSSGISDGSGNSAAFSTGVLVVQNSSTAPDSIQVGSVLIGNTGTPSSGFVTISPPASTTSYALTLPTIPPAKSFLTIDTSGNIASDIPVNSTQKSSSCGSSQTITGVGFTAVTNLSVTITTHGGPVYLALQSDGTVNAGYFSISNSSNQNFSATLAISKNGGSSFFTSVEAGNTLNASGSGVVYIAPSSLNYTDTPAAGTYTYSVYAGGLNSSASLFPRSMILIAYEV